MTPASLNAFCAICGDDIVGVARREPLGKDDALVNVCDECSTQTPREMHNHERGYQERAAVSVEEVGRKAANYLRTVKVGVPRRGFYGSNASPPTRGYIVVRVPRVLLGKTIDLAEAQETLRDQPWFSDLRPLGSMPKWHLFERPDPELASESRRQLNGAEPDPLEQLRKLGQK